MVVTVKVHLKRLVPCAVALQKLILDAGVAAAPTNVGTQSSAEKMSFNSVRGCTSPGQRTIAGTR